MARVGAWARAAAGWREAQELRVARFGDNMREVAVTEGDKVEAQMRLGVSVNGYGVGELREAVEGVAEADVDAVVAAYEEAYDLAPALGREAIAASPCGTPRGSRRGYAASWTQAVSAPSPTPSRISTASLSCRESPRNG